MHFGPPLAEDNRRRAGRVRCERLRCTLVDGDGPEGTILDLSGTGARLQLRQKSPYKVGEPGIMIVQTMDGSVLAIGIKTVWCKKRGFRRHELGVTFGDQLPAIRAALASIVKSSTVTNTVYASSIE